MYAVQTEPRPDCALYIHDKSDGPPSSSFRHACTLRVDTLRVAADSNTRGGGQHDLRPLDAAAADKRLAPNELRPGATSVPPPGHLPSRPLAARAPFASCGVSWPSSWAAGAVGAERGAEMTLGSSTSLDLRPSSPFPGRRHGPVSAASLQRMRSAASSSPLLVSAPSVHLRRGTLLELRDRKGDGRRGSRREAGGMVVGTLASSLASSRSAAALSALEASRSRFSWLEVGMPLPTLKASPAVPRVVIQHVR
jgi:hypothetical protein